jgi:hypothetical protein
MTYKNGFIAGTIVGIFITLIALGKIIFTDYTDTARNMAYFFLFLVFVFGSLISAYSAARGHCLISTTWDGAIAGISFIEGITIFVLYGFRL